jgi:hypothetical protein
MYNFLKKLLMASVVVAYSASPTLAMPGRVLQGEGFNSPPLGNAQLAQLRGGFIAPGGLTIDFSLTSQTLVDGVIQRDLTLNSKQLQNIDVQQLKQVIQIGANNNFESLDALRDNPGLVTVIQNTRDAAVIQNFNTLDLQVNNFREFRNNIQLDTMLNSAPSLLR